MAKRTCIFCGANPLTREHLFPNWMGETLAQDPRGLPKPYKMERWNTEGDDTPSDFSQWESKSPLDFVARCVCGDCNNGWMSAIEEAAKDIIVPMIQGGRVELDTSAQATLSTWAVMKTILAAYGNRLRCH